MLLKFLLSLVLIFPLTGHDAKKLKVEDKVLVFSLTRGYRHSNIEAGIVAIKKLGTENNFTVDATEDSSYFSDDILKKYKAIIFLSPTGSGFFTEKEKSAFQNFIHRGGGFVGIHAATDCLYNWSWYGSMVGAYFSNHPAVQSALLIVNDKNHYSTNALPSSWMHTDEWYNFKSFNKEVHVLLKVDETSYKGGEMNGDHPVSWYHEFEGGHIFYTALGHTLEDFTSDSLFLKHLSGGIRYALNR